MALEYKKMIDIFHDFVENTVFKGFLTKFGPNTKKHLPCQYPIS